MALKSTVDIPGLRRGLAELTGPQHPQLTEGRGLLELDKALLVQFEKAEEVHDEFHTGASRSGQLSERRRRTSGQPGAQYLDDLGHGDLVDKDVIDFDMRSRPRLERPQGRLAKVLRAQAREQVRLKTLETLVKSGEPGP